MEYKNENLGCSFSLPDTLTVRQQLAFWERYYKQPEGEVERVRYWEAGKPIVSDWQCEVIPDLQNANLDEMTMPKQTAIVAWVSVRIGEHIFKLEELPKA